MKRNILTFAVLTLIFLIVSAFKTHKRELTFKTVQIGNQIWMAENLNQQTFRNGDIIPEAKTYEEWELAAKNKQPAWCYYDNNPANGKLHGKLYNFHAVTDSRGLAPEGWHVSTNDDWKKLMEHCGGWYFAGNKLKSKTGWERGFPGTNETGFSALPSGERSNNKYKFSLDVFKQFDGMQVFGYFWTSSPTGNGTDAWSWKVNMGDGNLKNEFYPYGYGLSVRCVKDE